MKAIEVQFYGKPKVYTVIISNIKYIEDENMDDSINANLIFMDGSEQLLNINREQVTELINRR